MHKLILQSSNGCIRTLVHQYIGTLFNICLLLPLTGFGQRYFQQQVNYEIHVELNDVKHELSASEKIEYTNNSTDTLTEIYFHLWPNGYKDDETALAKQLYNEADFAMLSASPKKRGFIDSLDFYVNDAKAEWSYDADHSDICKVKLNEPLRPGGKITITIPFHIKIPAASISRMGHRGQAYYITQWYPKPAVYDRYGWHAIPYLSQGEFYSEFGAFDVYITLPQNYVLGATGDLKDEEELKWLDEKVKETEAITVFPEDMTFPPSAKEMKTLHYQQDCVHDFAWFADKRFHVMKGRVELPESKRSVTSWILFTNNQTEWWKKALEYVNDATLYGSKWVGEYPFNNVTAVDGAMPGTGGMEYPTITLIGEVIGEDNLEMTIAHEVGHNWFYGMLGSNEREHPWMDEGLTNFFEMRYGYTKYSAGVEKEEDPLLQRGGAVNLFGISKITNKEMQMMEYLRGARRNTDQSPDTAAQYISSSNYSGDVYSKTSVCLDYLKAWLGDSLFDACMHDYFNQWKFRHPYPEDVKAVFEATSKQNLDWIFNDLFRSKKKMDYGISSATRLAIPADGGASSTGYLLKLKNRGEVAGPFAVSTLRKGKVERVQWEAGFEKSKTLLVNCDSCDAIRVDAMNVIPELNERNNFIRTSGALKKWDPLKLRFFNAAERPDKTQIYFLPTVGYNLYDKVMAGMAFYNVNFMPKKFESVLNPMYSFKAKEMTGGGMLSYSWHPESRFVQEFNITSGFSSYHFNDESFTDINGEGSALLRYSKLDNSFNMVMRKKSTNYAREVISFHSTFINTGYVEYIPADNEIHPHDATGHYIASTANAKRVYNTLSWTFEKTKAVNPYFLRTSFSMNTGFMRGDVEGNYTISYGKPKHGFEIRGFAAMVGDDQTISSDVEAVDYRLKMSGWNGRSDYMFSEVFIGRSETEGSWSHQFIIRDGGFKVPTASGISSTWLAALNFKTSLPGKLPIRLFADLGFYDYKDYPEEYKALPMFDYGVEIDVVKDIFVVYLPIGWSDDIEYYYSQNPTFEKYSSKIRFEFNLSKLNPVEAIRKVDL